MSVATVNHFRFLLLGSIKCLKWGFPCGSAGKESACNVGDLGLIPGLGRSPGEGKGSPLQYSGLENSMDCTVNGVSKSQTRLSDFHSLTQMSRMQPWKDTYLFNPFIYTLRNKDVKGALGNLMRSVFTCK